MSDTATNIIIRLLTSGDLSGFKEAQESLEQLNQTAELAKRTLEGLGATVGVEGFRELITSSLELGKNISNLAERAQISTQAFQVLGRVAQEAGLDQDGMSTILAKLRGTIDTASESGGKAAKAFEVLGLNAKTLSQAPLEESLIAIARSVADADDKTKAYAAAVEILGARNIPKLQGVLNSLAHDGFDEVKKSLTTLSDAEIATLKESSEKWESFFDFLKVAWAKVTVEGVNALKTINGGMGMLANSASFGGGNWNAPNAPRPAAADPNSNPIQLVGLDEADKLLDASQAQNQQDAMRKNTQDAIVQSKKDEVDLTKRIAELVEVGYEANKKSGDEIQRGVDEATKLVDPFTDIEKSAQRINDAYAAGAISLQQQQDALKVLNDEAWAKAMKLSGWDQLNHMGQGGHQKPDKNSFQQISQNFENSQSTSTDVNKDYMTAAQGAQAALMQFATRVGSVGQQINEVFTQAFSSISSNLTKVFMGTETWRKALMNIVSTIEGSVVSSIINMGLKWISTQILMAIEGKSIAAGSAASMIPIAMAESEIWAAPAALATIASWGGAAVAAPELVLAAMMGTQAMAGFAMGGYTGGTEGDVAGIVHGGEYVFNATAVRNVGLGNLNRMHDMAQSGASDGASASGGAGESGHHFYFVSDMNDAVMRAHNNPAVRKSIISISNGRVRSV